MSSASSDAIAGVTILLRDIYNFIFGKVPDKDKSVLFSRIGVVITTVIALIFTLMADGVMGYIKDMISIIFSGMFACIIMGKFWKRATWQGGLACLIGGSGVAITFMIQSSRVKKLNPDAVSWNDFWGGAAIPAVSIALILGIVISLITPKRTVTDEEALKMLEEERSAMEDHEEVKAPDADEA
jgi:SSS family solute:Na+ symporter